MWIDSSKRDVPTKCLPIGLHCIDTVTRFSMIKKFSRNLIYGTFIKKKLSNNSVALLAIFEPCNL